MFSRWCSLARCSFLVTLIFASFARSQTTDGFNPFMVPSENQKVAAGSTWTIVWEPAPQYGSKVSISLLSGSDVMNMEDGPVLGRSLNAKDGKFAWTIPTSLRQEKCYGLKISLDSDPSIFEYSYGFQISFAKTVVVAPTTSAKPATTTAKPVTIKQANPATSNNPPQVATTLQTVISQVTKTSISSTVIILVSSASGAKPVTITESLTLSGSDGLTIVDTVITGFTAIAESSATDLVKISNAAETHTVSITALITAGSPNQTGTTTNSTISPTGLSKGAKAGISISVIIVGIIVCVVAWLLVATHYKRQQIALRRSHHGYGNMDAKGVALKEESPSIDLVPVPIPIVLPIRMLSDEERRELVNRRRAAELSGGDVVAISEKEGGEKDELEARRRAAKGVHELG